MSEKRAMRRAVLSRLFDHLQNTYGLDWSREVFVDCSGGLGHQLEAAVAFKSDPDIDELESALHRLDEGSYGACLSCNRPIGQDILDADPTTRLCPACEEAFSHRGADHLEAHVDSNS